MSSDDRFAFLLATLLAAGTILFASKTWTPEAEGLPDPPRLGGSAASVQAGPLPAQEEDDVPAGPREAEIAAAAALASQRWPEFASRLVFHPLAGDAPESGDLEHGVPYHLVVERDGRVVWTKRGRAAAPGAPAGLPVAGAVRALHVAFPHAGETSPERAAAARVVWRTAATRFGDASVSFADEVPGSTVTAPPGFDRDALVARTATGPATSRAAGPGSRPARVAIRFGTATIEADVADSMAERRDGLMGRASLRPNEGLLFVYREPSPHTFWMKDTLVPLDILYLEDDGAVIAVRTMQPPAAGVPDHDLPRFHSPKDCRLVLEVAAGMAAAHRIAPGSRIGLPDSVPRLIRESGP